MDGSGGNIDFPPKNASANESAQKKRRKKPVKEAVVLPPQLPRVREMSDKELRYTPEEQKVAALAKRDQFVQREATRKALADRARKGGFKTVEADLKTKGKIKEAPFRYKVLPPNIEPKKPKLKFFGMDTALAKRLGPAESAKRMANYKRDHADWLREKRRRAVVREQLTKGGVASDAFKLNLKLMRQEAEARKEAKTGKKRDPRKVMTGGNMFRAALAFLTVAMGGANMGAHYNRSNAPTEDAGIGSAEGETAVEAHRFEEFNWQPVPFLEAYRAAQRAEIVTGVDAEFLMSILAQESGWSAGELESMSYEEIAANVTIGHNIGDCRMLSPQEAASRGVPFGTGIRISREGTEREELIPRAMNMDRDWNDFVWIAEQLNFDPYQTPFSCPIWNEELRSYQWYGGAIGPEQYLPSEMRSRWDTIRAATGRQVVNPWDIDDALVAMGFHLKESGADQIAMTGAQSDAAGSYYAGYGRRRSEAGRGYSAGVRRQMRDLAPIIETIRDRDAASGGAALAAIGTPGETPVPEGETVATTAPPPQTP